MFFSFADLGFWRLAVLALVFELAHALLESHWPGIRGSRLGPRPLAAVLFMSAEAIALILAIAAGYRHSSKDAEGPRTHSGANLRYSCHGSLSNRRLFARMAVIARCNPGSIEGGCRRVPHPCP